MSRIGVTVLFQIKPGCFADFNAHIREHARLTLEEEPGCELFDVLQPLKDDGTRDESRIVLWEIYENMEALTAHRANPRMVPVGERNRQLLDGQQIVFAQLD
jgi:quinol monooxygenase YgiN